MKIEITYAGRVVIDVDPSDVADALGFAGSDEKIEHMIGEHVSEAASDREWPSYTINRDDLREAVAAVRNAIAEAIEG